MDRNKRDTMMVRFALVFVPAVGVLMLSGILILGHVPNYPITDGLTFLPEFVKSYWWTILLGFVPSLGVYIYSFKDKDRRFEFWAFAIPYLIFNISPVLGLLPGLVLIVTLGTVIFCLTRIPWAFKKIGHLIDWLFSWLMIDK